MIFLSAGSWGKRGERRNGLESLLNFGTVAAEGRDAELRGRVSPGRVDRRLVGICRESGELVGFGGLRYGSRPAGSPRRRVDGGPARAPRLPGAVLALDAGSRTAPKRPKKGLSGPRFKLRKLLRLTKTQFPTRVQTRSSRRTGPGSA